MNFKKVRKTLRVLLLALSLTAVCIAVCGCNDPLRVHEHNFATWDTSKRQLKCGTPKEYNVMNEVIGIKEATCGTEAPVWEGRQCWFCGCWVYHNTGRSAVQEHSWSSYITVANPTCTKAGEQKRSCDICLTVESRAIPALGHDYQRAPSVPATCTEAGHTARKECTRCGHFIGGETIPPLGHNWGKPSYAWSPDYKTCTGTVICKRDPSHTNTVTAKVSSQESRPACAENHTVVYTADFPRNPDFETQTATVTGPKAEHTPKTIRAVAATCTKYGKTAGKKCSVCGEIVQAPEITPPLGHIEEAIPDAPGTCVSEAHTGGSWCQRCRTILRQPTYTDKDPDNHVGPLQLSVHPYEQDIAPTCVSEGRRFEGICQSCGQQVWETLDVDLNNHANVVTLPAVAATCVQTGLTEGRQCTDCNTILQAQQETDKDPNNHVSVVTLPAVAATCVQTGLTEGRQCTDCNTILQAQQETDKDPNNHVSVVTLPAVAATCVQTGLTEGKMCDACKAIVEAQQETDKDPNNHTNVVTLPAVAATCAHTGLTEGKMCDACKATVEAQQETAKDPNNHEGGTYKRYYESPGAPDVYYYNVYCSSCNERIGDGKVKTDDIDPNNEEWEKPGNANGEVPVPVTEPGSAWKEAAVDDSPADAPESVKPSGKADGKGDGKQGRKDKTDGKGIPGDADSPTKSKPEKADGGEAVPGDVAATDGVETDAPAKAEGGDGNGAVDPASEEVKGEGNDSDMPSQKDAVRSEGISGQDVGSDEGEKPARENESLNGVEQSVDGNSREDNIADVDADRIP